MIQISKIAHQLQDFLNGYVANGFIKKFKIFIRINHCIDFYVVTDNMTNESIVKEFYAYLNTEEGKWGNKIKAHIILEEEMDDPFNANTFSSGENDIDGGPRYRFDSLLPSKSAKKYGSTHREVPIVTFYSYKGGMGRTTTMIACAMDLAINHNKKVVVIDCDLEAPGYLNFFDLSEHIGLKEGRVNGLVEFFSDSQFYSSPDEIDINDYMINVGLGNKKAESFENLENIWLVPAGNLNEVFSEPDNSAYRNDYLEGLSRINLSKVESVVNSFELLFAKIKETVNPDIILLDSRTGFNDIFGTAALYLSSCVVGFFGFNRQTQPGLFNLLDEYNSPENHFKLNLVFSILPIEANDKWIAKHRSMINDYLSFRGAKDKDVPSYLYLHRNALLEKIGTGDERSDASFIELIKDNSFSDYSELFEKILSLIPKKEMTTNVTKDMPSSQLRNVILKQLKTSLSKVKNFAEDVNELDESCFFYRECMKDLFNPDKFLIQGYKGTGKTYLYRALADPIISEKIQLWAGVPHGHTKESLFVNVLPKVEGDKGYPFRSIQYNQIEEPDYYFNCFWQVYTWNSLMLLDEFKEIRETSELSSDIQEIRGQETAKRFNKLINNGVDTLIAIEKDLDRINDYLQKNNKRIFVLYDRLDTCINPLRWNKAVSPLIDYWRDNSMTYSNIRPKIFLRTDLFRQIEGTNTARLADNIINIEWSIGEVFAYFFKLIFSNKKSADAYWAIAKKIGLNEDYINNTIRSFEENQNQFRPNQASMNPIIHIFFGKYVKVGQAFLGSPWDYFSRELANADNSSISLRPFINTMDNNAIDRALAKTEKYIKELVSPEIYASKDVRDHTTETYFNDLTQDAFSKDLQKLREVIRTAGGEKFRYKSLNEQLFNELLSTTLERIGDSEVVKTIKDLKDMIFANGIMAEKITTKGRFYRFAPIYHYTWGLENSELESDDRREKRKAKVVTANKRIEDGKTYEGKVIEITTTYGRKVKRIKSPVYYRPLEMRNTLYDEFYEDEIVTFVARKEPDKKNPKEDFWYADSIRLKED